MQRETLTIGLLGAGDIRALAAELDLRPRKSLGQNFVHDANTVRRIVAGAGITADDHVLEVGPGLGSLTLALLEHGPTVIAVEKDSVLAQRLPRTVAEHAPGDADRLEVLDRDVLTLRHGELATEPTAVVANLPYNVAVPALLHLLAEFDSIRTVMVMVQLEVAERLAAEPGGKDYGVPSAKARFFGSVRRCGTVPPSVFWPVPRVNSGLVRIDRYDAAPWPGDDEFRRQVFTLIDIAFAQRRKTLRNAFADWAGSGAQSAEWLTAAGIDPSRRGETLSIADFIRLLQVSEAGGSARLDGGEAKLGPPHQPGGSARLDGGEAKLGPPHQPGGSARLDGGEAKLGPPHQPGGSAIARDSSSTNSVQDS